MQQTLPLTCHVIPSRDVIYAWTERLVTDDVIVRGHVGGVTEEDPIRVLP